MKILGIETSCDETGVAVVECSDDGFEVLSNQLVSQIMEHRQYGGVYPNLAKRLHGQNLIPLLIEALKESGLYKETKHSHILENVRMLLEREKELLQQFEEVIPTLEKPDIDAIAVTQGPGLEPALWVGINFAKALSEVWNIPLIPVNHMEGHIASVLYKNPKKVDFPAISLLISGGHTELIKAQKWGKYELLGSTRDDAVGEAFDKVGRILGLPYPGGPEIARLAEKGAKKPKLEMKNDKNEFKLPRPMIDSKDYDFSFSGLKTAVLYLVRELGDLTEEDKQNISYEFQEAITDVLVTKTKKALEEHKPKTLIIAGGVAANTRLRNEFLALMQGLNIELRIPHPDVTGDNAIMIAMAGYLHNIKAPSDLRAQGNLQLSK